VPRVRLIPTGPGRVYPASHTHTHISHLHSAISAPLFSGVPPSFLVSNKKPGLCALKKKKGLNREQHGAIDRGVSALDRDYPGTTPTLPREVVSADGHTFKMACQPGLVE